MFQHFALLVTPTKQQRAYRLTHECDTPALTLSVLILLISLFYSFMFFFSLSLLFYSLVISKESNINNDGCLNRLENTLYKMRYINTVETLTYTLHKRTGTKIFTCTHTQARAHKHKSLTMTSLLQSIHRRGNR